MNNILEKSTDLNYGKDIFNFAKKLWPLNRSITGKDLRKTLQVIKKQIPNLTINSIPSGAKVFDWTVPKEWIVNEAYLVGPEGNKICDFSDNNLHLLGYSYPFQGKISLKELKKHLFTLPDQPNAIPYVTSYYKKRWGFCIPHNQFTNLKEGTYKVNIDTKLFDGELNYGEILIKGKSKKEIFLSTYICHPSMANNELSGPSVLTYLTKWLNNLSEKEFSYRIVFLPETIGSIAYLSLNHKEMINKIIAGFNITCIGDERTYSYLPSRNGQSLSDNIAKHILKWIDPNYKSYTWLDRGSDERQYCAPGIDLPIASIMRSKYGEYPEYHTSLDTLHHVVTSRGLEGGYWALRRSIEAIEKNKNYKVKVLCEPQMGKRGLYPTLSTKQSNKDVKLLMNLISYFDGKTSLLEIAEKLNVPIWEFYEKIDLLKKNKLIDEIIVSD